MEIGNYIESVGLEELRKIKIGFGHTHVDMCDRKQSEGSI